MADRHFILAVIEINAPDIEQAQQYVVDGLAAVSDDATVYLYDTFEEMEQSWREGAGAFDSDTSGE